MQAFSTGGEVGPVWSAKLPVIAAEAEMQLAAAEETVAHTSRRIPRTESRLHSIVQRAASSSPPTRMAVTQDEAELLATLEDLRDRDAVSFGISGLTARLPQANEQGRAVIKRLHEGLTAPGIVETQVGGALIARTHVALIGTQRTIWRADCTPKQAALHMRTVSLSLASRTGLVTALAAALRSAVRISVVLAIPGGPLLLVPSVLRCIAAGASGHD